MNCLWLVWLVGVLATGAILEGYALAHPDRMHTLSYWLFIIASQRPTFFSLAGATAAVGLIFHFWGYTP